MLGTHFLHVSRVRSTACALETMVRTLGLALVGLCLLLALPAQAELVAMSEGDTVDTDTVPPTLIAGAESKDGVEARQGMNAEPHTSSDLLVYEFTTEAVGRVGVTEVQFDPVGRDAFIITDGSGVGVPISFDTPGASLALATFDLGAKTFTIEEILATQGNVLMIDSPVAIPEPSSFLMGIAAALGLISFAGTHRKSR